MSRRERRGKPRRPSLFARTRDSLRGFARGISTEDLRRLVDRDAPRVYSVLLRDRARPEGGKRTVRSFLTDVRLLFESVSEKLPPARRLLFALSILAGTLALLRVEIDGAGLPLGPRLLTLIALGGLVFLLAAELVERVLVRDEIEIARQLQIELLPAQAPELAGWQLASGWRTANEIGGDYHRFQPLPDGRWGIVVADASGHGMAAGLLMAIADTALRIALEQDPEPVRVAEVVDRALRRAGGRRSFLTLFYGRLDPATGELDFVSAGHPSPIVRRVADGRLEEPVGGSLPLGLGATPMPVTGTLRLEHGDLLLVFSDGLFESVDARGDAFGHPRIERELAVATGASDAVARLTAAVERHLANEPLADDLTLVAVERLPFA